MSVRGGRKGSLLCSVLLVVATVTSILAGPMTQQAYAAQITDRSLELLTGSGGDGGSMPGGTVNHRFTFNVPTGGNVGSIKFEYCTIASVDPCVTPTGLTTTGATLGSDGGMGFTLNNTTNGAPYVTRTAANVAASTVVTVRLDGVVNPDVPSTPNYTFFVRITTYSDAAVTTPVDTGSVAASTSTQIELSGVMPESLIFCTGETIGVNGGGIPDCTTATPGDITFDRLFSPTDTSVATSQMAASTNAEAGYSISVNGDTLTSGINTIPAMAAAAVGARGTGQFGLNLRANTTTTSTPAVGTDVAPVSNIGNSLRAQPTTDYNTPDSFKFLSGDVIARSDFNADLGPTNSQIYTTSYMVNVSGSQPAGTYATTLTYVCTATF